MSALTDVPVAPLSLDRFRDVLSGEQWDELDGARRRAGGLFAGRAIWNVNSTAAGGGVAEMLHSLIPYARSAGVDARWVVIGGNPDFFALTKRLHNNLHGYPGDGGPLGADEHAVYERTLAAPAEELNELARPGDIVLLHDPQTAGLVRQIRRDVHVVWRSHIGRDTRNEHSDAAWGFLLDYVEAARAFIFSRWEYVPPGIERGRVTIVPPSIDAFSPKNQDLGPEAVHAIVRAAGLTEGDHEHVRPTFTRVDGTPGRVDRVADLAGGEPVPRGVALVTQVSRWDRLKDPMGILRGFLDHVVPGTEAHLMLAGPAVAAVSDDPEGKAVLDEVRDAWTALPGDVRARVHLAALPMDDAEENAAIVNALQRASTIVVQKSLAEGFGLTVAEAMWKARPVVASAVGGIQDQIEDGASGILLHDPTDLAAFGAAVRALLGDPDRAAALGAAARDRVRREFLNSRHLLQYEQVLTQLTAAG